MTEERLQKILARAGYGSRRFCEELIQEGRVSVNGVRVIIGSKADPAKDKITIDGKLLPKAEETLYIAVYKPRGVISAAEGEDNRQTVRDLVPVPGHLYPVGRLDFDSEGLILLTNDGELTNRLTHPRYEHEKEYRVLVGDKPDDKQLEIWRRGVVLEDGHRTAPADVRTEAAAGKGTWLKIIMHEGRKRQIREVGQRIGLPVIRIIRTRIGSLLLGKLKPGEWRYLSPAEVSGLRALTGLEPGRVRENKPSRRPASPPSGLRKTPRRTTPGYAPKPKRSR